MTVRRFWMLADEMARMSLKADASRLYLGYLWWVLEPLLYVGVFYVVFEVLLENRRADFLSFLMCGKLTFVRFSKSVVHASRNIVPAKGLIGKIDLPKALFPMASVQESLYKQLAVFALLAGSAPDFGHLLVLGAASGLACVVVQALRRSSRLLALRAITA